MVHTGYEGMVPSETFHFHALKQHNTNTTREQSVSGESRSHPGDIDHPDLAEGRPTFFNVAICNTLQPAYINMHPMRLKWGNSQDQEVLLCHWWCDHWEACPQLPLTNSNRFHRGDNAEEWSPWEADIEEPDLTTVMFNARMALHKLWSSHWTLSGISLTRLGYNIIHTCS